MVRRAWAAVIACLAAGTALAAPASAQEATPTAPGPARPDHVVIVMLENKDEGDVLRDGPYLASLTSVGASLTDMHGETHPSQPNYLALFSATPRASTTTAAAPSPRATAGCATISTATRSGPAPTRAC
jgi:acid phosphatase